MDLQSVFYTMGIIFMSVSFVFMIALVVLILNLKNKVTQLQKNIQEKVEVVESVGQVGGRAVEVAVDKIREFIESKNKTKNSNK